MNVPDKVGLFLFGAAGELVRIRLGRELDSRQRTF